MNSSPRLRKMLLYYSAQINIVKCNYEKQINEVWVGKKVHKKNGTSQADEVSNDFAKLSMEKQQIN
ncbi:CLUMA_CG018635, isoform A [Clunio marinus]|uniref:CLUMA_CG018635, isoform A n=1 Tax=Clunio marinus TaxID=568069 RepID=A0A1J1J0X6_9DIPT|nr:CLUMA_CG018635, isoform A [Clunio marinus]